jgi:hypothetical protein
MSQDITITIDGKDGRVVPESVANVLSAVFETLHSLDERSWAVGTARIRWRISQVSLRNPLTLTVTGDPVDEQYSEPHLVEMFLRGINQIEKKRRPSAFSDADVRRAKMLGDEVMRVRSLSFSSSLPDAPTVTASSRLATAAKEIIDKPKAIRSEYGSVEGTLIMITNDPLKDDAHAKLRERDSGAEVRCDAEPHIAANFAPYVNRETRIVLYGDITYEGDLPARIKIETFAAMPSEDSLPTLADIHAMKLRPPSGTSMEDYLDELRDDG